MGYAELGSSLDIRAIQRVALSSVTNMSGLENDIRDKTGVNYLFVLGIRA